MTRYCFRRATDQSDSNIANTKLTQKLVEIDIMNRSKIFQFSNMSRDFNNLLNIIEKIKKYLLDSEFDEFGEEEKNATFQAIKS